MDETPNSGAPRLNSFSSLPRVRWFFLFALALSPIPSPAGTAAQMTLSNSQVKAVFLYNLAEFTDWPADSFSSPQAPLVVCVVGDNRILFEFERMIAGKSINGRELRFRKYSRGQDVRDCQILFFGAAGRKELPALLQNVRGANVLTVSDADDFTETGGAIRVLIVGQHVRFEINQEAVTQAHLKISSKLLSLTRISLADRRPGGN